MRAAISNFFTAFESAIANQSKFWINETEGIYKATYDLARYMNLSKDFESFVDDQKKEAV
jgi:hypothetical protein